MIQTLLSALQDKEIQCSINLNVVNFFSHPKLIYSFLIYHKKDKRMIFISSEKLYQELTYIRDCIFVQESKIQGI